MASMQIDLRDDRTAFEPGEELTGTVSWKLDAPPRTVELRLFWFTRGKGTEDAGVVETVRLEHPGIEDTRPFRFRLPDAPYSVSGKLLSLLWALELVAEPSKTVTRRELVMAPDAREVQLKSLPDSLPKKRFLGFGRT
jgi:hypothetical protein